MSHFDFLLQKYPELVSQDGLIALISEFNNPNNCLCYPELKDLRFRLTLAGCSDIEIEAIANFSKNPLWEPQIIESKNYKTFGKFLVDRNLTKFAIQSRVEYLVHQFQRERNISGLKPHYQKIRNVDVNYLAPSNLALLEDDKLILKNQVRDICNQFISLTVGYKVGEIDYSGDYEELRFCNTNVILDAGQLACKASIGVNSWYWEGSIGKHCWKREPDEIVLWLDFGFDEESRCLSFKAVNPNVE